MSLSPIQTTALNRGLRSQIAHDQQRVTDKAEYDIHRQNREAAGATFLDLAVIRQDGGTQSRAEIDPDVISDYAQAMRELTIFPPVVVYHDGEHYWLADGFHRVKAAAKAKHPAIEADVRQGTQRDAILFSTSANGTHGLRPSNADKRRAVEMLLRDKEWSQWSDRAIARQCHVSPTFVGKVRKEVTVHVDSQRVYKTRHGKASTMDTANIGKSYQEETGHITGASPDNPPEKHEGDTAREDYSLTTGRYSGGQVGVPAPTPPSAAAPAPGSYAKETGHITGAPAPIAAPTPKARGTTPWQVKRSTTGYQQVFDAAGNVVLTMMYAPGQDQSLAEMIVQLVNAQGGSDAYQNPAGC